MAHVIIIILSIVGLFIIGLIVFYYKKDKIARLKYIAGIEGRQYRAEEREIQQKASRQLADLTHVRHKLVPKYQKESQMLAQINKELKKLPIYQGDINGLTEYYDIKDVDRVLQVIKELGTVLQSFMHEHEELDAAIQKAHFDYETLKFEDHSGECDRFRQILEDIDMLDAAYEHISQIEHPNPEQIQSFQRYANAVILQTPRKPAITLRAS